MPWFLTVAENPKFLQRVSTLNPKRVFMYALLSLRIVACLTLPKTKQQPIRNEERIH
jgi:hypothetical protein